MVAWIFEHCVSGSITWSEIWCVEVFTQLLSVGFNYNRTRRTQTPKSVSTQQINSQTSSAILWFCKLAMCVDTITKSSETQHKDNCLSFCFFQSYNVMTPRMDHWTCSWTSLIKIHQSRAWLHTDKNLRKIYCSFCSQGLSEWWHYESHNAILLPVVIINYY